MGASPGAGDGGSDVGVAAPDLGVTSPDAPIARRLPRRSVRRRTHCVSSPTSKSVTSGAARAFCVTGAAERASLKRQMCVANVRSSRRVPGGTTARSSGVPAHIYHHVNMQQVGSARPDGRVGEAPVLQCAGCRALAAQQAPCGRWRLPPPCHSACLSLVASCDGLQLCDGLQSLIARALVRPGVRTLTELVARRKGTQQPCCIQLHGAQVLWHALQMLWYTKQTAKRKYQRVLDWLLLYPAILDTAPPATELSCSHVCLMSGQFNPAPLWCEPTLCPQCSRNMGGGLPAACGRKHAPWRHTYMLMLYKA